MIELLGLEGYTGLKVAPLSLIEELKIFWEAEHEPRDEDKTDEQRLADAEREMGMRA
jgi:hypothetical protein